MDPSESNIWQEALSKLRELEDEVRRVEELVASCVGPEPAAEAAGVKHPSLVRFLAGESMAVVEALEEAARRYRTDGTG